jgi:hypothetical protein
MCRPRWSKGSPEFTSDGVGNARPGKARASSGRLGKRPSFHWKRWFPSAGNQRIRGPTCGIDSFPGLRLTLNETEMHIFFVEEEIQFAMSW